MMGRKAEAAGAWGRRRRIRRPDLPGQQGNNSEFLGKSAAPRQTSSRKHLRIQLFTRFRLEIPCATEQGSKSTATGKQFNSSRELIRANREMGAKPILEPRGLRR